MKYLSIFALCLIISCKSEKTTLFNEPPEWSKHAVWYQVFVDRFRNADLQNDHTIENIQGSWPHNYEDDWSVSSWTSNWFSNTTGKTPKEYYDYDIQSRRYGGDLQGILDKLDYISELGVTAIYINPLNDSPSLHKFDARNYRHLDINIGQDPAGDKLIIESETPLDPTTWKLTSADHLFLKLIQELHKRDIKIVMDYSWNHTGIKFWAWEDILVNGSESKYAHWYEIIEFDDPKTAINEFEYVGWAGVPELPELKKVEVESRIHGKPYKGNLHPEIKKHVFNVSKRWMDPNGDGDPEDGVDGFRLDVADQIGMDFWIDYRKFVRDINPEALLVGEIWWEKWPDLLMDPLPYVSGDVFDNVMFYQAYKPARAFFAKTNEYGGAEKLVKAYKQATEGMSEQTIQSMMMMSSSHDSPRLLTSFQNKGKYKYNVKPADNPEYETGKPDQETIDRVKLFLAYQFTMPGAPQIWAGDEMGMWGGDDPDCRKPLWWDDLEFEDETEDPFKQGTATYKVAFDQALFAYYQKLIELRKNNPVLRIGELNFTHSEGDLLAYQRLLGEDSLLIFINNSNSELKIKAKSQGIDLLSGQQMNIGGFADESSIIPPLTAFVILEGG